MFVLFSIKALASHFCADYYLTKVNLYFICFFEIKPIFSPAMWKFFAITACFLMTALRAFNALQSPCPHLFHYYKQGGQIKGALIINPPEDYAEIIVSVHFLLNKQLQTVGLTNETIQNLYKKIILLLTSNYQNFFINFI